MIENVTLTSKQYKLQMTLFGSVVLIITLCLFMVSSSADPVGIVGWRSFSSALGISSFLFMLFYRWFWRVGSLPEWLGKPLIGGVWIGHIASNFGHKPGEPLMQKPIVFVVRQTFLTLSIQSFTDYQVGLSRVEVLLLEPNSDLMRLPYVFELENEYSGASTVVNGAGILKLLSDNNMMKGEYWTSSPTHGTLILTQASSDMKLARRIKQFTDATSQWPVGSRWPRHNQPR